MKTNFVSRWLNSLAVGVFLFAGLLVSQKATAASHNGVSFQIFYDELAPYGDWVRDARHGYIWLPAVDQNFHPYGTDGHWVMTEYGNTWVSYFDWGWAPFHYGRWYFDDFFQSWAWVPGYQWGPAWVNWRTGGGYYGWAPLGPGASFNMVGNYSSFHWVFLPRHRIYHHHAYRYYAPHRTRVRIYNNTTIINNTYVYNNQTYISGPSRSELQQVTHRNVPVYQVQASNTPGRASMSRNSLSLYRPEVQESRDRTVGARPSRILEADQAKSTRSSRELNATTPSRNATMGTNSPSRTLESPRRSALNSDGSTERTAPTRSAYPSANEGTQRSVVTPMPDDSRSRSTYTAPSRVQSSGSREEAPARSTQVRPTPNPSQRTTAAPSRPGNEVRSMEQRTQPSAPARESVQQSRPTQAPARTQVQERVQTPARVQAPVNRSEPARTQVTQPSRTQSGGNSSEVKAPAPARQSDPATQSRTSSTPSRSSGRGN
jgi:hypothetical protein